MRRLCAACKHAPMCSGTRPKTAEPKNPEGASLSSRRPGEHKHSTHTYDGGGGGGGATEPTVEEQRPQVELKWGLCLLAAHREAVMAEVKGQVSSAADFGEPLT